MVHETQLNCVFLAVCNRTNVSRQSTNPTIMCKRGDCLLAVRSGLSPGRMSDLQMHRNIRHLAITGSCSCQIPAGRFPNGGESYATNEDRGLFDPIFEYAHRCIGRGSSHHCGTVDYCHLFERRQVRQLHYEQVNQRSRCELYSGCRRLAPPS
jgi:hypothetical protein